MHARLELPSLRQLRAFEAVARCKSIGAGARELGLSQPAVTHMIAQLETRLAVSLLERRRSGSFLTPLGSVLLPRVRAAVRAHSIDVARSGYRRIAVRARDDQIRGEQNYRYAYPCPCRDRRMRLFRDGGASPRHIPAGAASIRARSRARGSQKPVSANGAGIGPYRAGTRARAPAEGCSQRARIRGRRDSGSAGYFYVTHSDRQHTPLRESSAVTSDQPISCHIPQRICSRPGWALRGAARGAAGRRSRPPVRGTQAPGVGDRPQRRVSVLEPLCHLRWPPAPARSRSEDNAARAGQLRLDIARSRRSAQGGI